MPHRAHRIWSYGSLSILMLTLAVIPACQNTPPRKLGYIDTSELLNKYDKAVQVRTELQASTGQWQAEAQTMQQELDALRQRYISEHDKLSSPAQRQLREEIAAREQAFAQYVQEVNQKASALEAEKMQPVYRELNAILREYGRAHGYYIILGATPNGNIVYADSSSNLTDEVLAYIQTRKAQQPKTEPSGE